MTRRKDLVEKRRNKIVVIKEIAWGRLWDGLRG